MYSIIFYDIFLPTPFCLCLCYILVYSVLYNSTPFQCIPFLFFISCPAFLFISLLLQSSIRYELEFHLSRLTSFFVFLSTQQTSLTKCRHLNKILRTWVPHPPKCDWRFFCASRLRSSKLKSSKMTVEWRYVSQRYKVTMLRVASARTGLAV
jgi:hypothetical protein